MPKEITMNININSNYTITQTAHLLGISQSQVRRLLKCGKIKEYVPYIPSSKGARFVEGESLLAYKNTILQETIIPTRSAKYGMKIPEAAVKLGVSQDWIRSRIRAGILSAKKIGRVIYISNRSINALFKQAARLPFERSLDRPLFFKI